MASKYTFIEELNDEQKEAATHTEGALLVIAGAGSGKTKTIIARTAYIIAEGKAAPNKILVMTFTNKAAKEMRERGARLLLENHISISGTPTFSTFHSWGLNFLRNMSLAILQEKGFKNKGFSLVDTNTQTKIVKSITDEVFSDLDPQTKKEMNVKSFLTVFDSLDNKITNHNDITDIKQKLEEIEQEEEVIKRNLYIKEIDEMIEDVAQVYSQYKAYLRQNNSADFNDLIKLPCEILRDHENVKKQMHDSYDYIMLDEFQDTNHSQMFLCKMLLSDKGNICVVGDDSQSIYGWRGAHIEYILNFHKQFKDVKFVNLKTNYRSVKSIVGIANNVLDYAKQKHELKDKLVAFNKGEGLVEAHVFQDSDDEVNYVSKEIDKLIKGGVKPNEITVLYRTRMPSRIFEEGLLSKSIKVNIWGGIGLMDRKIVLDFISYLRFIANPSNEIGLIDMLLTSKTITDARLSKVRSALGVKGQSLKDYITEGSFETDKNLTATIKEKFKKVKEELGLIQHSLANLSFKDFCDELFKKSLFVQSFEQRLQATDSMNIKKECSISLDNLKSIYNIMIKSNSLQEFIESVTLDSAGDTDKKEDCVNFMTVHASKGLEFDYVFVVALTEGLFPMHHKYTDMEEERRLAYVAFTRARIGLYATASNIYPFRKSDQSSPSRFLYEAGLISKD